MKAQNKTVFYCFINHCASHFAYFRSISGSACYLGLDFSVEIAYSSQSRETHLGSIKKFVALIQLVGFSLPVGC